MEAKPGNFIVSLVYLLGVVLPGSIVVFFAVTGPLHQYLTNPVLNVRAGSVEMWVIIAIASYIAGQALYGFGSWFLDNIYERTYRRYRQFLRGNPETYAKPLVESQFRELQKPTTYSWARAVIVAKSAGAGTELEQVEADLKFFRSLALVFLVAPFEAEVLPSGEFYWALAVGVINAVAGSLMKVAIEVSDRRRTLAKLNAGKRPERTKAEKQQLNQSLNASAFVTGFGLAVVLGFGAELVSQAAGFAAAAAFLVGFAVVFLRFCQQRWQRTESTYTYAAAVAAGDLTLPPASATPIPAGTADDKAPDESDES